MIYKKLIIIILLILFVLEDDFFGFLISCLNYLFAFFFEVILSLRVLNKLLTPFCNFKLKRCIVLDRFSTGMRG
jgi:hypothetical protein